MVSTRRPPARAPRTLRFADWIAQLEATGPTGCHLLSGPETLLRDQALLELRQRAGNEVPVDRFLGGEASLAQVANAAITVGLFHPRRLVVLSDADRCGRAGKREREELIAALETLPEGSCFVATTDLAPRDFLQKNEFARGLGSVCHVVELAHPRPAEALRWIQAYSAKLHLRLTPDAGEMLLGKVGPDLQELARELEKLSLWAREDEPVGTDRLRELVRQGHLGSAWQLCDALLEGRSVDAFRAWEAIRAVEPVPRLLWILQQRARESLSRSRGGPEAARLERMLLALSELEQGIKSGFVPARGDAVAFERAILSVTPSRGNAGSRS